MSSQPVRDSDNSILVVDDLSDNLQLLSEALSQQHYEVRCATSGQAALAAIQVARPDLILLDPHRPDLDGYAVCAQIKGEVRTQDIPILFISTVDDTALKVKAFEAGAADYITKPFSIEELVARIKYQISLKTARLEITRLNTELEARMQQRTAELEAANHGLVKEIAERKRAEEKLLHDALHDELTQLPNRVLFMERVAKVLHYCRRYPHYQFAVLFLDLDRFKIVNDSLGHAIGDQLLVEISRQIASCLREMDTVARLGGDEFTILLENVHGIKDAVRVAERVQAAITAHFCLEGHRIFTSASIGIAMGGSHYQTLEEVLRDADIAMYQAKALGRSRYAIFDQGMYLQTLRLLHMENDLRLAIDRGEFSLNYQPIVSLRTGKLAGFEALLRWKHPQEGFISPAEFIPVAEDTGLIVPLGEWVLRQACQQMRHWQQQYPAAKDLRMSVNLAGKQLQEPCFIQKVDDILAETGLRGEDLRLELTESMLMERTEEMIGLLQQLRDRQIQLSIDDFGTGYSSLSYLHRFPVTTLKIDRSFVSNMNSDAENFEIVRTVITLAHTLSMEVVAEGVETPEQSSQLRDLGCEYGQGYLFSRPLDEATASTFLADAHRWRIEPSKDTTRSLAKSAVHPPQSRLKPALHPGMTSLNPANGEL